MTLIVNLYGGPGTGKSTTAAHTFALLKQAGVNCELVTEYAKDKVWEKSFGVLSNQLYVLGKQHHRLFRCLDQVEVVVTDSPLLISLYYGQQCGPTFLKLVKELHDGMNNLDVFLKRVKPYQPIGRMQTESEARGIDEALLHILRDAGVDLEVLSADDRTAPVLAQLIQHRLHNELIQSCS